MTSRLRSRLELLSRSLRARRYAKAHRIPGLAFDGFGRRAGIRLLAARDALGWHYLINPVSIVRYWEFSFVADELPLALQTAADVGSPRLFSFWAASEHVGLTIDLLNPDARDTAASVRMASALKQERVTPRTAAVDHLPQDGDYDAIWSISVVEHIHGSYEDTEAVRMMYQAVRPGGHLILTVPVGRNHRDEYRTIDAYGTQHPEPGRGYFFQRVYDERSLRRRLIDPLPEARVDRIGWFGERQPGHFQRYEQDWLERGHGRTVDDPREIADHYREYSGWDAMPGMGVCGIHLTRASVREPDDP